MKKSLSYLLLLSTFFLVGSSLQAQTVLLDFFNINSDGADVLLEWQIQAEDDVNEFRLFRKFNDEPSMAHVATIQPSGTFSYQYLDDDIFKNQGRVLHYELQVVTENEVFKFQTSLSHNPTSIQRTWGSIKSMFR